MQNENESIYLLKMSLDDSGAFDYLFLKYQPKLLKFMTGFLHDDEIARNLTQDIFMEIWQNRKSLRGVNSFSAYLFKSAKNYLCNYFRHELVRRKYDDYSLRMSRCESVRSPEEEMFVKDLVSLLDSSLKQIPDQRRKVFLMSRAEGLSNDEIASSLGISKRTVENHITKVLAALRKAGD